jgi:transposase-like protein
LLIFNQQAAELLEQTRATDKIKAALKDSSLLHVDETSINICGKRRWKDWKGCFYFAVFI